MLCMLSLNGLPVFLLICLVRASSMVCKYAHSSAVNRMLVTTLLSLLAGLPGLGAGNGAAGGASSTITGAVGGCAGGAASVGAGVSITGASSAGGVSVITTGSVSVGSVTSFSIPQF